MSSSSLRARAALLALAFGLALAPRISAVPLSTGPTLRAADLVVVDYQSDTVDQFALLVLAPIPANSVIYLTDAQWLSNGNISAENLGNTETLLKWTTPATLVPAGTVVRFVPLPLSVTIGTVVAVNATPGEPLSVAGDQLIIYQTVDGQSSLLLSNIKRLDAAGQVESGPIYTFNLDNSPDNTVAYSTSVNGFGTVGGSHASGITTTGSFTPPSSTLFSNTTDENRTAANAFGLGSFFYPVVTTDWDDVRYNGPVTAADKSTWLQRVHNTANWIGTEAMPWTSSGTLTNVSSVEVAVADATAPTVVSVIRQDPTAQAISTSTVVFRVTYSEPVKNVAVARFTVAAVGSASSIVGSVTGVTDTGDAKAYDVAVTISSGTGEFRLHVID